MVPPAYAHSKPAVEVAFVLDTTGSMSGLIEGAKRKDLVDRDQRSSIPIRCRHPHGLVAYRDIGDDYVTKTFDLTTDIQDLYGNLLQIRAQGGGDWPESVNEALDVAVNKLQWTTGQAMSGASCFWSATHRRIWITSRTRKYPEALGGWPRHRGIIVNAVLAGNCAGYRARVAGTSRRTAMAASFRFRRMSRSRA